MKIKIVQRGYETFSGLLGDVKFAEGVSTHDVSPQQAAYVAAMFVTEQITDSVTQLEVEPSAQVDDEPVVLKTK